MPTVVAKGAICLKLDGYYASSPDRWESLVKLRSQLGMEDPPVWSQDSATVTTANDQHLKDHWFGPNNWWRVNATAPGRTVVPPGERVRGDLVWRVSESSIKQAKRIILRGLIEALEVSLGLDDDGVPSVITLPRLKHGQDGAFDFSIEPTDYPYNLSRDLPVTVYWVCGKVDGFEVEITWNEQEVSCHIVTPPISLAFFGLQYSFKDERRRQAKQTDPAGMVWVHAKPGNVWPDDVSKDLVALEENGVTPHGGGGGWQDVVTAGIKVAVVRAYRRNR